MVSNGSDSTNIHVAAEIFAITYWIPHADGGGEEASPFQGFQPGILETSGLLDFVAGMPMDIRELFTDRSHVLYARLAGFARTRIVPISISSFEYVAKKCRTQFNVVIAQDSVAERSIQATRDTRREWLHFSKVQRDGSISFDDVNDSTFADYFRRIVRSDDQILQSGLFDEFIEDSLRAWEHFLVDCPRYMHNLTRPNERALSSLQVSQRAIEPMSPHAKNLYIAGSIRSARAVAAVRSKLTKQYGLPAHVNDLTVAVDSTIWGISGPGFRENLIRSGTSKREASTIQATLNRAGYSVDVSLGDDGELGDIALSVLGIRAAELRAFTSALLLHSGLRLTPVLRLNPGLNRIRPALIDIGACARGNGPHRDFKLNKLVRRLGEDILAHIDIRMVAAMRGSSRRLNEVALVSDLPLEWLPIDGVPLGLKHDVSRIPCNPGNVMLAQCVSNEITFVSKRSFDEILVVRSFRDGDPISRHLEVALSKRFGSVDEVAPRIKVVDVSSPEEFVEEISRFKGSVMIFDGHGTRDSVSGVGSIVVGGQPLDVWELRGKIRLPPIVLLSACDTYPVDGSHGSSAIGMLALGARTVLGTMLPVHSLKSSSFLARLIYRLTAFLPIAMNMFPRGLSWKFVMSGMLRMVYSSEVIQSFSSSFKIDLEQRMKIQLSANTNINSRNPAWYDLLKKDLAVAASLPPSKVQAFLDKYCWITDSMSYVQLGRPELIHVVDDVPIDYDGIANGLGEAEVAIAELE